MDTKFLHKELKFRMSRSSGKGGQHVNKVSTRVELLFHIENSSLLDQTQKELLQSRLRARLTKDGQLLIARQNSRSQLMNKRAAIERFDELISQALKPLPKRKKVKPLRANKAKRLESKRRLSQKKQMRKKVISTSGNDL